LFRSVQLPASLRVTHEPCNGRVDRERHVGLPGELAETPGPRVVHPEAALEVDLARRIAPLAKHRVRLLGAVRRRASSRPETERAHAGTLSHTRRPSDRRSTVFACP